MMSPFPRSRAAHRAIALLVLSLMMAGGCTSWRTAEVTPQVLLETEKPAEIRVTARDDTRQIVRRPRIAADTLTGLRGWRGKDSIAVALSDISRVEWQRGSAAGAVVALVVIAGVIVAFVGGQTMSGPSVGGN